MPQKINALILDDNEIIANCLRKRIFKANESHCDFTGVEITPHFLPIDLADIDKAAREIASAIIYKKIDILLLDRGFYSIIDPSTTSAYSSLNDDSLYCSKDDNGQHIEDILKRVPKDKFKRLSAVIVYTYDEEYVEAEQIRQGIKDVLPEKFDKRAIDVILTYPEVYRLSDLNLYTSSDVAGHPDLDCIGKKSGFMLYGLFIGELLYHRAVALIKRKEVTVRHNKQVQAARNVVILFIIFASLNLGANALYSILSQSLTTNLTLLLLSVAFALILPLLILVLKPDWILNIEE